MNSNHVRGISFWLTFSLLVCCTNMVWSQSLKDHLEIGNEKLMRSDYVGALQSFEQCLNLAKQEGRQDAVAALSALIGEVYGSLGDYHKALSYSENALKISKELQDRDGESMYLGVVGKVQLHLGNYPQALTCLEQALAIETTIRNLEREGELLGNLGEVHLHLGDHHKALHYSTESMKILRSTGDFKGEGWQVKNIGDAHYLLGDSAKAVAYYEQALKILRDTGDTYAVGEVLGNIARAYYSLHDYLNALSSFEQQLEIKAELGDRKGEGDLFGIIGNIYAGQGNYHAALSNFQEALKIGREIKDRKGEGNRLNDIGNIYSTMLNYPEALSHHEQALSIVRDIQDPEGEMSVLGNIGSDYSGLGEYLKALSNYEQALDLTRKTRDPKKEVAVLGNIGSLHISLGDIRSALSYQEQALKIAAANGDPELEVALLNNLGVTYAEMGDHKRALSYHEESLKINKKLGNQESEASNLGNISRIYFDLGDYSKALEFNTKTLDLQRKIGIPTDKTFGNIGEIYLEQGEFEKAQAVFKSLDHPLRLARYHLRVGDYTKAVEKFTQSLKGAESSKNSEIIVADYIGLGLSYEGMKDYANSKEYYQKAIAFIEVQRDRLPGPARKNFFSAKVHGFSRIEPYEGLVRVSSYTNDTEAALFWAENTRARLFLDFLALGATAGGLGIPQSKSHTESDLTNRIAALRKQMDLAVEKNPDRHRELASQLETLIKERDAFIAQLRLDYPEYSAIRYSEPLRVGNLQLGPQEVLIEYEVTENETFAWLVRGAKVVKAVTIPITRKDLTERVKTYRGFFEGVNDYKDLSRFDAKVGKELYYLLFKFFALHLKAGEPIIIIPDEILGILPFEALVVSLPADTETKSGEFGPYPVGVTYFGDQHPISTYQSATALSLIRALKKAGSIKTEKMLVLADPIFDPATDTRAQGKKELFAAAGDYQLNLRREVGEYWQGSISQRATFPRLETTSRLADSLKGSLGNGVDVLKGLEATKAELKKRPLAEYRYQVFATHGILDESVPYIKEPALVLTRTGNAEDSLDGFLTMTEVMDLKLGADLVALTACNTGVGKNLTGEGVMGMGRAFQYAGAKSVLMSLWSVEDESTNLLTERLFAHLKAGKDRLEALRLARADLRQAGYEHPFFWAPFILMGER